MPTPTPKSAKERREEERGAPGVCVEEEEEGEGTPSSLTALCIIAWMSTRDFRRVRVSVSITRLDRMVSEGVNKMDSEASCRNGHEDHKIRRQYITSVSFQTANEVE